jgi:hypothetical protein
MKVPIRQEDDFGCGLACIAYLKNMKYGDITSSNKVALKKAQTSGYRGKFLADILNNLQRESESKWKTKYCGKTTNPIIPNNSIVYISKNDKYQFGHYIVKTEFGFMNPFSNLLEVAGDSRKSKAAFEKEMFGKPVLIITNSNVKFLKDLYENKK